MEKGSSGKRVCPHEIDFFEKKILTNQKTVFTQNLFIRLSNYLTTEQTNSILQYMLTRFSLLSQICTIWRFSSFF